MLGGGHGWLQGQFGLSADNLLSARLVLANGTAITVSDVEHSDLFWALKGAGHNFGIVTSFQYRVYDRTKDNENFALETMIFTGDKLEDIYTEANKMFAERPVELTWFSMLFPMPAMDPDKVC
jgi:FAD/FMN-containing dehydrogenase